MPIRKILVVDDSATERHALTELLTRKGYQVVTAVDGEEGIRKSQSEAPDLILMDVVMPGVNGYQATRMITRNDATKKIPVIMCTTKGQETDKIWGLRQGAFAYFTKPIDASQLLAKIATLG